MDRNKKRIETRKDMWAYIHEDMKRNLVSGGGKVVDNGSLESSALLHRESEALRVLVKP